MLQKFKDGLITINWALYSLFDGDTWDFFNAINSGWSEMEFLHRYGDNPTEQDYLEWMSLHPQKIYVSEEDFDSLIIKLESSGGYDENVARVLSKSTPLDE